VTVLDFACGTGTFLLEVFERAFDTIGGSHAGRADGMVREHLTKNIYGFEYLIAPYTIAHLKLSQYLRDKGHPLEAQERLQVFLTNTLEPVEPQGNLYLPALAEEVKGAQAVKDKPILVITGNPPYSARSKNRGAWIRSKVKAYEFVDGKHFAERKHWLNDDYVKFIRFAQLKLEPLDEGVIAIITNRWWIENVTFRGMRQSIIDSFDKIYILDLGGEAGSPNGDNVFDITKGVAISILIKDGSGEKKIQYSTISGARLEKYKSLSELSLDRETWEELHPNTPNYFLVPTTETGRVEYECGWSISDIFPVGSTGVLTARDRLAVAQNSIELREQLVEFASETSPERLNARFGISNLKDSPLREAQVSIGKIGPQEGKFRPIAYRPFDVRVFYDDDGIVFRRRNNVMQHMGFENIALSVCRLTKSSEWSHVLVSNIAIDDSFISDKSKERAYLYPINLRDGIENINPDFRETIDEKYSFHYSPEEIAGYIYAILYSMVYRNRFGSFLRISFPRIPLAKTREEFEALSSLGWALVRSHLFILVPNSGKRLGDYFGKGNHVVDGMRYSPDESIIWINKTQGFGNVPQHLWEFHIGGYQVLEKYLKSRKGRALSLDEQTHLGEVCEALNFTVAQMALIDEAYIAAFPVGDNATAALAPNA